MVTRLDKVPSMLLGFEGNLGGHTLQVFRNRMVFDTFNIAFTVYGITHKARRHLCIPVIFESKVLLLLITPHRSKFLIDSNSSH